MEEIEELRRNNHVMTLTYIDTDSEVFYDRVAPICFKGLENDQYLPALTEDDRAAIFPVAHITCVKRDRSADDLSLAGGLRRRTLRATVFRCGKDNVILSHDIRLSDTYYRNNILKAIQRTTD